MKLAMNQNERLRPQTQQQSVYICKVREPLSQTSIGNRFGTTAVAPGGH